MNTVIIVLDSVGWDLFCKCNVPNMRSLGEPHQAFSSGLWTVPSFAEILKGQLPRCLNKSCYHNKIIKRSAFFLDNIPGKLYFFTANGWLIEPYSYIKHPKFVWKYFKPEDSGWKSEEMIQEILNLTGDYLVIMHVMETHSPYKYKEQFYSSIGEEYLKKMTKEDLERLKQRQIKSVEYIDKIIKPLIDMKLELVITADHGENFELGKFGHDQSYPVEKNLYVPIISNVKNE